MKFKIVESFNSLRFYVDDRELSLYDLVKLATSMSKKLDDLGFVGNVIDKNKTG